VCTVCVFAAPSTINYDGVNVPAGLNLQGFETWATAHPDAVLCEFNYNGPININVPCNNGPQGGVIVKGGSLPPGVVPPSAAAIKTDAIQIAKFNYPGYKTLFLYPSYSLMVRTGLWIELEAAIGFIVGLGLGSLLGQRTISVILMLVLEVVLTPIFSRTAIPHLINLQRSVVGLATAHLEPGGLPLAFGGGGGGGPGGQNAASLLVPESRTVAIFVIAAWIVGWTVLGAWRMATRDA
jgi:hypothetical protein